MQRLILQTEIIVVFSERTKSVHYEQSMRTTPARFHVMDQLRDAELMCTKQLLLSSICL